jgi:mono/diheme cytochrome c family protein
VRRVAIGLLSLFVAATAVEGASAADARQGETLAKRWCATCHVVASDQRNPTGEAPPFSSIGRTPDLDASKLALFLLLPHPHMPAMTLSRAEAADLAAYIASQGK